MRNAGWRCITLMKREIRKYSVALGLVSVIAVGPALAQESGLEIGAGEPVYDAGATETTSSATSDYASAPSYAGGPIFDNSGFQFSTTTITFDEFSVPIDTIVTTQYAKLGATFEAASFVQTPQAQGCDPELFPGLTEPGCLGNFTSGDSAVSCPGPRSILFTYPTTMAGFNIVTNAADSAMLTAYLGGTFVATQVVDTDFAVAHFIGFAISSGFDELELEIIADAGGGGLNRCMLLDHLTFLDVLPVYIDIKPGSFPNSINLSSGGATPLAILGSATLDVNDIDVDSLSIGTAGVKTVGKKERSLCSIEDVSGDFSVDELGMPDGFDDLVCHFVTMQIAPEAGDTTAKLSGNLLLEAGGIPIRGIDSVNIVP